MISSERTVCLALLLAALAVAAAPAAARAAEEPTRPPRAAVIVAANAPSPGRKPLLHAYRDAERVAAALTAVGRFAREEVEVLHDPAPAEVLAALTRARGRLPAAAPGSLLYFYYSGHADERALYPGGRPLPMETLRAAIDETAAAVRIGMLDACRGGGWTRTKGLVPDAAFEVQLPLNLENEGSVLIASSSGLESAHESDLLQGSFFTHHFVAALRGAGDKSGNGEVTLTEAFEYAKERTVRDTAHLARTPQHPSYAVNLRGRQDLVLAQVRTAPSTVALSQRQGPLEIIHLETGLQVLELGTGPRHVRVALPPGRYLVRRPLATGNLVKEVVVSARGDAHVAEGDLVLAGSPRLSLKGDEAPDELPALAHTTLRRGDVALGLAAGAAVGWSTSSAFGLVRDRPEDRADVRLAMDAVLGWGITDRLTWAIGSGAFTYRFGACGGWEIVPQGGIVGWGYSSVEGLILQPLAGVGVRRWIGMNHAITVEGSVFAARSRRRALEDTWRASASTGWSSTLAGVVTLNVGAGVTRAAAPGVIDARAPGGTIVDVGAVQLLGLRRLPLVQIHVTPTFSLELQARVGYELAPERWRYASLLGFTKVF